MQNSLGFVRLGQHGRYTLEIRRVLHGAKLELRRRYGFRIEQLDSFVTLEVGDIEGEQMPYAVPLHGGDKPRVVGGLALYFVLPHKLSPHREDAAFVTQKGEYIEPVVDCLINSGRRHIAAVFRRWPGGDDPILVENLRHKT